LLSLFQIPRPRVIILFSKKAKASTSTRLSPPTPLCLGDWYICWGVVVERGGFLEHEHVLPPSPW